jgi:glycosyltransferase involved in cell wall biosynthesis
MRISVVCPVFETPPALLAAALASVREQDGGSACEIILVDDGSRNLTTRQAIDRACAQDERILAVRTGDNRGPAGARNAGIRAAQGEWVGFLDSDDVWRHDHLSCMLAAVTQAPEACWIAGNYAVLGAEGRQEPSSRITEGLKGASVGADLVRLEGKALTRRLIANTSLHLGATFVRKELLAKLGEFTEGLVYGEDWLFFVRLSVLSALHAIAAEIYLLRRQHESLMRSPQRLTGAYVAARVLARQDPLLCEFRRELRWSLYSTLKGLALNNLLAGFPIAALSFAARAWCLDPREAADLLCFLRLLTMTPQRRLLAGADYSRAEIFTGPSAA